MTQLDVAKAHPGGAHGIEAAVREQAFLSFGADAVHVWRVVPRGK